MALIDPCLFLQADAHPARSFRQLITATFAEGILGSTSFAVTQRGAGANFSVDVAAGMAVVKGDSATQQGCYLVVNDATVNDSTTAITSAPSAGNERYDRVILEVKDNAEDAGGINAPRFRVVAGTPAAVGTAVAPALPNTAITLAVIGPIVNSTTTITNSLITDGRTAARLANDVVGDSTITTAKIADSAVTSAKIANGTIATADLADGSVTSAKIADATITETDIAATAPGWTLLPLASNVGQAGTLEYPVYTKFGNMVIVTGAFRRSTSGAAIGTMPSGFRPPATTVAGVAACSDLTARMVSIDSSGNVAIYGGTVGTTLDVSFYAMFRTS